MMRIAALRDPVALTFIAGAILVIGAFALCWPVHLDAFDRWGFRIDCGTGLASTYDQAQLADRQPPPPPQPQSGYVDACQTAVLWRRAWGASLIAVGGGGVVAHLLKRAPSTPNPGDE